jgi:predicted amidohydrolase
MERKFKIALCQLQVEEEKGSNLAKAARMIIKAANGGAKIVSLPEIWNTPYYPKRMVEAGEPENGKTVAFLSELARGEGVYLIGGSIPEVEGDKLYNTAFVFNPKGEVIAKNRKTHLFDIDIPGVASFKESDTFTPGDGPTVFDTPEYGKIGLAICFDLRFAEMFSSMKEQGANLIFLPTQFTAATGALHWEQLVRSRALDNQIFFAGSAAANNQSSKFHSWGHSMIATPMGDICGQLDEREGIVFGDIDYDYLDAIRQQIPLRR